MVKRTRRHAPVEELVSLHNVATRHQLSVADPKLHCTLLPLVGRICAMDQYNHEHASQIDYHCIADNIITPQSVICGTSEAKYNLATTKYVR